MCPVSIQAIPIKYQYEQKKKSDKVKQDCVSTNAIKSVVIQGPAAIDTDIYTDSHLLSALSFWRPTVCDASQQSHRMAKRLAVTGPNGGRGAPVSERWLEGSGGGRLCLSQIHRSFMVHRPGDDKEDKICSLGIRICSKLLVLGWSMTKGSRARSGWISETSGDRDCRRLGFRSLWRDVLSRVQWDGDSGTSDANWRGWGLKDISPEYRIIRIRSISIPAEGFVGATTERKTRCFFGVVFVLPACRSMSIT
ncbi:hypothetical protein V8C44DRAFT_254011 [Trichoderma aethiopicum]